MSKLLFIGSATLVLLAGRWLWSDEASSAGSYRSPVSVAFSGDGKTLFVVEQGSRTLAYVEFETGEVLNRVEFESGPLPSEWPPEQLTAGAEEALAMVAKASSPQTEPVRRSLELRLGTNVYLSRGKSVGILDRWKSRAMASPNGSTLKDMQIVEGLARNAWSATFTPDGRRMLVTCDPLTESDRPVCVVDFEESSVTPVSIPGASALRGIASHPNGRYALVAHVQARSHLPATQIAQGWVFTNAVTLLPLASEGLPVTLPLDHPGEFYATPFDVVITPDGKTGYVSHAGADVVSVLDLPSLEQVADEITSTNLGKDYAARDLRVTGRYVRARIPVGSNPRAMALDATGDWLAVANHLDDSISVIETTSNRVIRTISLSSRAVDLARLGEQYFHSARLSFSGQFSCASCHPDGGTDGLNWDLPADGIGNFKNTKTLRGVQGTEPFGWLGTTATFAERFGTTLEQTFQHQPTGDELRAITAYLEQLDHTSLPSRVDSSSAAAMRGRALFEGKAACASCHRGPQFTDLRRHNVGTGGPRDLSDVFDTPSLVGVASTPPYLHDGRTKDLPSIFREHNESQRHGRASRLERQELDDLVAFLRSL